MARVSSLRTERKFKKTEIGEIPVDWETGTLKDYAYIKGRIGWRGLKASEYTEKGPFLIANKHIIAQRVIWDICDHISKFRYKESPEIQLKIHDIIMSKDGTIGQVAYMDDLPDKATINSTMMLIRVDDLKLNPKFLYYFFQGPHFKSFIQLKILGSSVPHIFQRDMQDFTSVIPPVVEQKKIAEILTTVDEAIGKSNEIIEKTKELKKGLMQELLARGIGHKRFKKTKIGEIPVDWVVVKLSDVAAKQKYAIVDGPFGSNLKLKDYVDSGIPVLQGKNITSNRLEWFDIRYVTEEKARELSRSLVKVGDILITKIGTVGCSAIVDDLRGNKVALIPANLMKISLNEKKVNCKYLHQWLVWSETKKRIVDTASQTAQPALSLKVMKPFKVTLPPLPEQKKIAEILSAVDEEIEKETANKEKLEQTKKGLMQVLLTGKKRV